MYFLYFLAGAGLSFGLFFIFCDILKVPTYKTSRTMMGMEKHFARKESRINSGLEEIAVWLSKYMHIRDFKKAQMQADLNTARMKITPERYMADCIVKAGVIGCLAIPLIPIFPLGAAVAAIAAVVYYFVLMNELRKKVNAHRLSVEMELVQMIFTIERVLMHSRNVMQMLENYREIAGDDMKQEIDITLADMFSGNHEQAISRLEIRVGSMMMSDVCRGLISVIRGDDTTAYWINLQQKFTEHQRSQLKQKAEKIPQRVNRLSMALLFAFMALWLGAIILEMADSLGAMFGVF